MPHSRASRIQNRSWLVTYHLVSNACKPCQIIDRAFGWHGTVDLSTDITQPSFTGANKIRISTIFYMVGFLELVQLGHFGTYFCHLRQQWLPKPSVWKDGSFLLPHAQVWATALEDLCLSWSTSSSLWSNMTMSINVLSLNFGHNRQALLRAYYSAPWHVGPPNSTLCNTLTRTGSFYMTSSRNGIAPVRYILY